jgi:acetolactate synthase-1/2/3 large subunit
MGPGIVIPTDKKIIQVNSDEWDVNNGFLPNYVIIGDAKLVLRQLCNEAKKEVNIRSKRRERLEDEIQTIRKEFLDEWQPYLTSNEVPINPYRIFWDLKDTVEVEKTIITHEAGQPRNQLLPIWEAITPRSYIGWGHHSTMGFSLGAAIGAKLARPESTVINVMGDGAFGMTGIDFETAVREEIPILTMVLNNFGLASFKKTTPSTSILSGNYAKVGEGLGGYAERVEKPDEVVPSIKRALKSLSSGRSALLEFIVKYERASTAHFFAPRRR